MKPVRQALRLVWNGLNPSGRDGSHIVEIKILDILLMWLDIFNNYLWKGYMKVTRNLLLVSCSIVTAATPKVSVKELGGFLKVIVSSAGGKYQGRMDCLDSEVTTEMKSRGVAIDVQSPIAFAANLVQVRTFNAVDKLVICTDKEFLKEGATIAIVKEDGKPVIYFDSKHKKEFEEAGVTFSDVLIKIAKFI